MELERGAWLVSQVRKLTTVRLLGRRSGRWATVSTSIAWNWTGYQTLMLGDAKM